jgi:hypothetical protein
LAPGGGALCAGVLCAGALCAAAVEGFFGFEQAPSNARETTAIHIRIVTTPLKVTLGTKIAK